MYYGSYVFLGTTVQEISLKFNDLLGVIQKKKKNVRFFQGLFTHFVPLVSEEIRRNQKISGFLILSGE